MGSTSSLSKRTMLFLLPIVASCQAQQAFTVEEIGPGVYSFNTLDSGEEYMSMFIVTGEGVIVIEPVSTAHSTRMLEAIGKITGEPVKYMLHSHNHYDHGSGGAVWRAIGATIIAHEFAYQWMEENLGPDQVMPDEFWSGTFNIITLGNVTLELRYLGLNHGLGNTFFLLPELKIGYAADIVTPKRVMFSIVPDFNLKEWEKSLDEILLIDFDKCVFSHNNGPDKMVGTKQDVVEELQFMRDLRAGVMELLMQGMPLEQVAANLRMPQYEDWAMYKEWLSLNVWRMGLDIWMGPFPWVPGQSSEKIQSNIRQGLMHGQQELPKTPSKTARATQVEEIGPGVYSFNTEDSGNEYMSMFIVTGEGVIVIEPVSTAHSTRMLEAIGQITAEPVKYMLHSHNHYDHGSGGAVWRAIGATIIAHEFAYQWMEENLGPDQVM